MRCGSLTFWLKCIALHQMKMSKRKHSNANFSFWSVVQIRATLDCLRKPSIRRGLRANLAEKTLTSVFCDSGRSRFQCHHSIRLLCKTPGGPVWDAPRGTPKIGPSNYGHFPKHLWHFTPKPTHGPPSQNPQSPLKRSGRPPRSKLKRSHYSTYRLRSIPISRWAQMDCPLLVGWADEGELV